MNVAVSTFARVVGVSTNEQKVGASTFALGQKIGPDKMFVSRETEKMRPGKLLFHVKQEFWITDEDEKSFHVEQTLLFHVEQRFCFTRNAKKRVPRGTLPRSNAQHIRINIAFEPTGLSNRQNIRIDRTFESPANSNGQRVPSPPQIYMPRSMEHPSPANAGSG